MMQSKQSKYWYPGTEVLINNFNIRDPKKLETLERIITGERLAKLYLKPIYGKFDLKHLQAIHKFLFSDIYPFAGKIRDENIAKGGFSFANAQFIEESAKQLFKELANEKHLKGYDFEKFSERAAYYLAEINVLHPFREGNGRTQREFIRLLALKNGYSLQWSRIDREELLSASIRSITDINPLVDVLKKAIINKEPDRQLTRLFENARGIER